MQLWYRCRKKYALMMKPWNFRRFWYRWSWNRLLPVWNRKDGWQQDGKPLLMSGLYFQMNVLYFLLNGR